MANNNAGTRPSVAKVIESISSNHSRFASLTYLNPPLNEAELVGIAKALSQNTHVETVNLTGSLIGSPAAATSTFLKKMLETHPSIKDIKLSANKLSDNLAEVIGTALKTNTSLTKLFLWSNNIGPQGAEALSEGLKHNKTLQVVLLGSNQLGDRGAAAFGKVLCISKTLEVLILDDNGVTGEGAKALALALEKASIKELDLHGNKIQDEGGKAIAESLCENKSLTRLDLDGTGVGEETCNALAAALRSNSSLKVLGLTLNGGITDIGAVAFEGILKHLNFAVEAILLYHISGVTRAQRDRIHQLCAQNRRLNAFFQQVNQNIPAISHGVWPRVLETVECKPDLLFALLKVKPDICREPQQQKKRRPEWRRY